MRFSLFLGTAILPLSLCFGSPAAHAQDAGEPSGENKLEDFQVPSPPPDAALPEVDPIIEDAEFSESVPDISPEDDPEMDRPLESIAEFERRLERESQAEQDGESEEPPLGDPALADGDPVEEIGDAPIRDQALTEPLPPVDQFELATVEFAEPESSEESPELSYRVRVNGLDEADKETRTSLSGMFSGLSALKDGGRTAANAAMISARLEEDAQLMQTILESEGWYSARINTRLERPVEPETGQYTAVIDVRPGKRYSFSEIVIDAKPTEPPNLIRDNFALEIGEPIVAERVQGAEAQISVALPENGYPFVELGQRDILLDRRTGEGVYTLPVNTGPRSRFGGFTTDGDMAFDADHVDVLARFDRGELYDSRMVDDLRKALVATSLFSTVSVEPRRTNEAAGDGTEYVTVHVNQEAGPPRTIAGSAGYGTGEGFRLEASWTHRNLFPPEGALIVHGVAGTSEQGAGVTFRRSNAGKRDRTFELVAEALRSDFSAYNAYTGRLAGRISYDSTPIWQKRLTYSLGAELLATAEKDYNFDLGRRDRRTFYIGALNGQVGLDYTNDLLDPTSGFRLNAIVQPEGSLEAGFNPYVRARIDASGYFPVSDDLVLAGRVRVGTIQGAERFEIAPSRRFYAGGGGSVRGYGYQKLGQLDPDGDPIGGRSLNEASAEVRYRFGNYGVVAFVDAGQSYVETMPQFNDIRFGAGIGGRFYTNFGPIRLDVATPINRRPGESRINIYVSIGQAF